MASEPELLELLISKSLEHEGLSLQHLGRSTALRRLNGRWEGCYASSVAPAVWKRYQGLGLDLPFSEPFDLALALRERLMASDLVGHVAVEPGGGLRLFSMKHLDVQKKRGRILCKGCSTFFQEGNPFRTHVQNAQDTRCFSPEAAEYYLLPCQDSAAAAALEVSRRSLDPGLEAARDGNLKELQRLVESRWDPLIASDHHGNKALHWAAGNGHLEICRYLVQMRMDPKAPSEKHQNRCALHWAARNGQTSVCAYLLDLMGFVDVETDGKDTPLMLAAWQGHLETCRFLATQRADLNHLNSWGCNAMHKAARMDGEHSSLQMLDFLLSNDVKASLANCNGHNALHKAASFGSVEACRFLLLHGLDTRQAMAPDRERNTPSSLAFAAGYHRLAGELRHTEDVLWLTPAIYRAPETPGREEVPEDSAKI
ncbi:unnamed protein product [Durusdinium trenchii]|uniref:Uncharacterized protein n=1 Tax=Durusdinium trenchii TaxID=1381693 RepID=A0ABP0PA24_9DINO